MEAELDGTGQKTIAIDQNGPTGVAVDASHVYWNFGADTIVEANLDGTGQQTIATDQNHPEGVAVSHSHRHKAKVSGRMTKTQRKDRK